MVGIAIINYKSYKKTIECIESIRKTTNSLFKIYLLENGSNDESAEILFNEYKNSQDVHLIISDVNHGYVWYGWRKACSWPSCFLRDCPGRKPSHGVC